MTGTYIFNFSKLYMYTDLKITSCHLLLGI